MQLERADIKVPLDVPKDMSDRYRDNLLAMTHESGRLMLFAGDQKVEHLNKDFYGDGIPADDNEPEHLFRVASGADIGVFATQLGLIARYGMDYREVPYLVKLNSKSNLVKTSQAEPFSNQLYDVEQVEDFRQNSGLNIHGVGYTIYLGSEFEAEMLAQAARVVYDAHQYGMLSVLWIYPRGEAVADERDPHLIAGATGVAACLGSDFVKVNPPKTESGSSAEELKEAVLAAGRTRVICAGGSAVDMKQFLQGLHDQIHIGGASGNATGRNIHQRDNETAMKFANAIFAVTVRDMDVAEAMASAGLV